MPLTPTQRTALTEAIRLRIFTPVTGAYRRKSGEVDNKVVFNRRTIRALVEKGLLVENNGGYFTTETGKFALQE